MLSEIHELRWRISSLWCWPRCLLVVMQDNLTMVVFNDVMFDFLYRPHSHHVCPCLSLRLIGRRHGHVFRMALHNSGDWRMETWQRARRASCHVSIRQSPSGLLKLSKGSWTVTDCGRVTLNCVQMASKQEKVWVFISHFSVNLLDFTALLSYRHWHFETAWPQSSNQPGATYCQALNFWLRTNYKLEMWCADAKLANHVPTSPVRTIVIRMALIYCCFEWQGR